MEVSLERLSQMFLRTPMGKEVQKQQTAEASRQILFVKRKTLQHQQITELPSLKKAMDSAARDLDAARKVMQEKQDAYDSTVAAYQECYSTLESQLAQIDGKLRFSASPAIDAFITRCRRQQEEIRTHDFYAVPARGDYNLETGRYRLDMVTNADTIRARLKALQQAAQEAEALKLENLTDEEVHARLTALDATLTPHRAHGEYDFAAS